MGTETRYLHFDRCNNPTELRARWREAVEADTYNRGHEIYNGSIRHAELSVNPVRFKDAKAAEAARDAYDVDKREAVAFGYGDPSKTFPQTAADKKLVETLAQLDKDLENFEFEVLKRFAHGKSASRKCTHCESVVSRKSRVRYAARPPSKSQESHFDYRDSVRMLTACPCCGGELLMTDTDKKRKASLSTRSADLHKKVTAAREKFFAKTASCGYYIVAGCPS